jgi:Rrf2 family protein
VVRRTITTNRPLQLSEAANLGVHALVYLAQNPEAVSAASHIAEQMAVSSTHLSKVMGRLAVAGFLTSTRGARGGFALACAPEDVTVLEIVEAIDGPLPESTCMLGRPICSTETCAFTRLHDDVVALMRAHLGSMSIADLAREVGRLG